MRKMVRSTDFYKCHIFNIPFLQIHFECYLYLQLILSISSICKSQKKYIVNPQTNLISLTIVGMFDLIVIVGRHLVVKISTL